MPDYPTLCFFEPLSSTSDSRQTNFLRFPPGPDFQLTQIYSKSTNTWRNGPAMPAQITAFGCLAVNSNDGFLVGGLLHTTLDAQTKAYTYDRAGTAFADIGDLEDATSRMSCGINQAGPLNFLIPCILSLVPLV